jgi:hypothetical protein
MSGYKIKKLIYLLLTYIVVSSCSNSGNGELIGVSGQTSFLSSHSIWNEIRPYW